MVGAAGHFAVGVLNLRRSRGIHRSAVRLIFLGNLPQAVELALDLVHDVAAAGRIIAGELVRTAGRIIPGLQALDRTVDARADRDGIRRRPASHVEAIGVYAAVAIGV